jgi:hypothetical protein
MKNTYKIPEGCTSISIEQIGNKIVTEFETLQIKDLKVEPKVVDCVKYKYKGNFEYAIYIGSDSCSYLFKSRVCDGYIDSNNDQFMTFDQSDGSKTNLEILTHTQFQSEVNALGFEYNFKNGTFKALKWVPKENEAYWFITCDIKPFDTKNNNSSDDKEMIKAGNCFKTKSECESAIEKIKNVLKSK